MDSMTSTASPITPSPPSVRSDRAGTPGIRGTPRRVGVGPGWSAVAYKRNFRRGIRRRAKKIWSDGEKKDFALLDRLARVKIAADLAEVRHRRRTDASLGLFMFRTARRRWHSQKIIDENPTPAKSPRISLAVD